MSLKHGSRGWHSREATLFIIALSKQRCGWLWARDEKLGKWSALEVIWPLITTGILWNDSWSTDWRTPATYKDRNDRSRRARCRRSKSSDAICFYAEELQRGKSSRTAWECITTSLVSKDYATVPSSWLTCAKNSLRPAQRKWNKRKLSLSMSRHCWWKA